MVAGAGSASSTDGVRGPKILVNFYHHIDSGYFRKQYSLVDPLQVWSPPLPTFTTTPSPFA